MVVLDEVVEPLDERVEGSTVYELVESASSSSSPPQAATARVKIATVKRIREFRSASRMSASQASGIRVETEVASGGGEQ